MFALDMFAVSAAKSASWIWLRDADRFCEMVCRLAMVEVKRFCTAPRSLRMELMVPKAASMRLMVSFAPLVTADSNGGVIVTDWYVNPRTPGERVKLTVSIIDQDLRADALRVAASRQVNQNGVWVDAPVAAATVQKLEDIILTRARDLRRTTVGG